MKMRLSILATMSVLLVLTTATSAFAQGIFTLSGSPGARGRMNGHAEMAGAISVIHTGGAATALTGTVAIDYGVPITNAVGATDGDNSIAVIACVTGRVSATVAGNGNAPYVTMSSDSTTLTLHLGTDGIDCSANATSVIDVSGVRLSLVGSGLTSVEATVTTSGNIRGGSGPISVIRSVVDELTDDGVSAKKLEVTRHTGVPVGGTTAQFVLVFEENTNDSFDGANINLEFSGIPEDVKVTLDAWTATKAEYDAATVMTDPFTTTTNNTDLNPATVGAVVMNDQLSVGMAGRMMDTVTAEDNEITVFVGTTGANAFNLDGTFDEDNEGTGGSLANNKVDVVIVQGSVTIPTTGSNAVDLPLDLDIQVTASVGPTGRREPETADGRMVIPRFASDKTEPVTVIEATADSMTMKVAYVLSDGTFDTGISVANMTSGRSAQTGAIHISLYMAGNETKHSTGMVGPQSSVTMLLSEILRAAGHTGRFAGYMIIEADFSSADAGVFISDFSGFTAGATVRQIN